MPATFTKKPILVKCDILHKMMNIDRKRKRSLHTLFPLCASIWVITLRRSLWRTDGSSWNHMLFGLLEDICSDFRRRREINSMLGNHWFKISVILNERYGSNTANFMHFSSLNRPIKWAYYINGQRKSMVMFILGHFCLLISFDSRLIFVFIFLPYRLLELTDVANVAYTQAPMPITYTNETNIALILATMTNEYGKNNKIRNGKISK